MVRQRPRIELTGGIDQLLRQFRRRAQLTQEQLAEKSGLSVEAIRTIEIGRRKAPRAQTISLLSGALDLLPADYDLLAAAARRQPVEEVTNPLPASVAAFFGREEPVRRLSALLGRSGPGTSVAAITGMGGVGKTALALYVAHHAGSAFPDGRVYLNLRGATDPIPPLDALGSLLRSLGVRAQEIPDDIEAAIARYRTVVAERKLLLVLDDATDADQVVPLIPGTAGSAVLITSRHLLDRLPGAEHLRLDVLSDDDGLLLLGEIAGRDRLANEEATALEVVRLAGNLPLAICIAGSRLARQAGPRPLRVLAERLADESTRLGVLADGETGVRASIAVSIDDLCKRAEDQAAAAAFPILALLDTEGFPLRAAAAALGLPIELAESVLDRLVDVHLLEAPGLHRYRLHDLVRAVGREWTTPDVESKISARIQVCYLAMIWRADELSGEGYLSGKWKQNSWAAAARDLDDVEWILDWLDAERATLVRLVRAAATQGETGQAFVIRTAVGLNVFGPARKRWLEWRDINRAATEVVDARVDQLGAALVHFDLGLAYGELEDYSHAAEQLAVAVSAARNLGEPAFLADSLVNHAHMLERLGRTHEGFKSVKEALGLAEQLPTATSLTWATLTLGMLHGKSGEGDLQKEVLERAILLARGAPPTITARIMLTAGASLRESGQVAAAIPVITESLQILRDQLKPGGEAEALDELGTAHRQLDDPARALELYRLGLEIAVNRDLWDREASLRTGIGQTLNTLGQTAAAHREWETAERILSSHGIPAAADLRRLRTTH